MLRDSAFRERARTWGTGQRKTDTTNVLSPALPIFSCSSFSPHPLTLSPPERSAALHSGAERGRRHPFASSIGALFHNALARF